MKKLLLSHKIVNNWNLDSKKLLVGVSGGVDSITLLFSLLNIVDDYSNIEVLHVNYLLRGEDNNKEVKIIQNICSRYKIKMHYFEYNFMGDNNFENDAREFRYSKAQDIVRKYNLDYFVTGHNLNDFLETYFIKKVQKRDAINLTIKSENSYGDIKIIRPLLFLPKRKIYEFAKFEGLLWIEDYTNNDSKYLRNKIRKKLNFISEVDESILGIWAKIIIERQLNLESKFIDITTVSITNLKKWPKEKLVENIYYTLNKNQVFKRKGFYKEVIKLIYSFEKFKQLELSSNLLLVKEFEKIKFITKNVIKQKSLKFDFVTDNVNFNDTIITFKERFENVEIRYIESGDRIHKKEGHKRLVSELRDRNIPPWKRNELIIITINKKIHFVEGIFKINDKILINI